VRRILVGFLLALSLGMLVPALFSSPALAGRGDQDFFGGVAREN
jgi:hypothetical protein